MPIPPVNRNVPKERSNQGRLIFSRREIKTNAMATSKRHSEIQKRGDADSSMKMNAKNVGIKRLLDCKNVVKDIGPERSACKQKYWLAVVITAKITAMRTV